MEIKKKVYSIYVNNDKEYDGFEEERYIIIAGSTEEAEKSAMGLWNSRCSSWTDSEYNIIVREMKKSDNGMAFEALERQNKIDEAIKILQTIDWVGSGAKRLIQDVIELLI